MSKSHPSVHAPIIPLSRWYAQGQDANGRIVTICEIGMPRGSDVDAVEGALAKHTAYYGPWCALSGRRLVTWDE